MTVNIEKMTSSQLNLPHGTKTKE